MLKINWKLYYSLSLLIIIGILSNLFYFCSSLVGIIMGIVYFLYFSLFFGHMFFNKHYIYTKLIFGLIMLFSYLMISGSIFYYLYKLAFIPILLILIIAPIFLGIELFKNPLIIKINKIKYTTSLILKITLILFYLSLIAVCIKYLLGQSTTFSINTPWKMISPNFFILYVISILFILFILYISKSRFVLFLLLIHFFFSFSIILIIYKLGFGYDPFLHQASEKLMSLTGTFSPKPFYYIGQYSLVVILSKVFNLSVPIIDKLLVPVCASLFLPVVMFQGLKNSLKLKKNLIFISCLLFLLIPFTFFTYTTPQALSNVFLLILIFLSLSYINKKINIWPLIIITFVICFIHLLSGIPAIIFLALLYLFNANFKIKIKNIFIIMIAIMSSFIIPLSFVIFNFIKKFDLSNLDVSGKINLFNTINPFNIFWPRFINIQDLVYLYSRNINIFILITAILGFVFVFIQKRLKDYIVYLIMFFVLLINYFIMINYVKFPFLYDFSERIFNLAFLFLMPLFFVGIIFMLKIIDKKTIYKIFIFLFLAIFLTISFYLSYPRSDKYENFHGYSISQSHLKVVEYIEQNFGKFDYAVLSDQSVGATLIQKYGFRKYYNGEFYYSLPTNIKNNIYSDFLNIFKDDLNKLEIIKNVVNKTNVDKVFVVINAYWSPSDNVLNDLKKSADNSTDIDNGKIYIFEYDVK